MEPETATTPPPETQAPITAMEDVCTTPPESPSPGPDEDVTPMVSPRPEPVDDGPPPERALPEDTPVRHRWRGNRRRSQFAQAKRSLRTAPKAQIHALYVASGASAVSADLYEPTCTWLDNRVKRIVNTACILATGAGLKTVQPQHIEQALVEEKLQVLN
jgi:histone H3/H4